MTMKLKLVFLTALTTAISGAALADGAKLYVKKACHGCHGKDGKKTVLPEYPRIAGQNVKYLEKQMLDIRSGARGNGNSEVMKGLMTTISDEEIKAIAQYVSTLK